MTRPKAYIAYTADTPKHQEWVERFAEALKNKGIRIWLDVWFIKPGDPFRETLSRWLIESDFVIVIGTPRYGLRASNPGTGAGRESSAMEEALQRGAPRRKYIPILREGDVTSLPSWLRDSYYIDFRDGSLAGPEMGKLLDAILGGRPRQPEKKDVSYKLDTEPVVVNSLRIENVRAIASLEIHPPASRREGGRWIIFLGDNGVGKTTLLQAIGLASIAGEHRLMAIAASTPAPFMSHGANESSVHFQCEGRARHVSVEKTVRGEERFEVTVRGDKPPYFVFGYGCGRGSALGGPERAVELERSIDGVATLFGLPSSLIHGETWLRSLEHAALKNELEGDKTFFEAVRKTVLGLLPGVDEMEIRRDHVWLRGPDIGECALSGLSDGYITTLGWSLDFIARWSHVARKLGARPDGAFNEKMTGLVLIDELDLHLHPRWQTRVIADIRKAFPKMSFVVTTHNPLTLLGAGDGEIHILERDDDHGIICHQVDLPLGIRADKVLTGAWFGLSSTLDPDTRGLLEKHRRLLRKGTPRDDPGRRDLERKIKKRLGSYADTSEERLAMEAAARVMKDDKPLTHAERAKLQQDAGLSWAVLNEHFNE